jgi:hypothetical protein
MKTASLCRSLTTLFCLSQALAAFATNPLIMDQFTADPTARVFEGKLYLYPSHDIIATPGKGRTDWFCMEDYHVFSSDDLMKWTDHGVIVKQTEVGWANPTAYSMWAPDCVAQNGKYYFYFPAIAKEGGFHIGVAISDSPHGPFTPEATPINGVRGIDPCVLIDKDGTAYLYYSMRRVFVAKLKANMVELDGAPKEIANLPEKGLLEGPFVFERDGIYYLTYPHVENKTERLEYAMSRSPLGPFKPAGVIMDESPTGCWTNHQSIVEFKGQWYLFYHDKDLSPDFDKARSARAERLFFNDDGTIRKVIPTLRGVGIVDARSEIQIDRYSETSGCSASFIDPADPQKGWKLSMVEKDASARFDDVEFGNVTPKSVKVRASSPKATLLEIHLDSSNGPLLARVQIPAADQWEVTKVPLQFSPTGLHNLAVKLAENGSVDVDWIRFE